MADFTPPESPRAAPRRPRASGTRQGGGKGASPPKAQAQPKSQAQPKAQAPRRDQARRPGPPLQRNSYAAIDLGTNNCRLLIARPSGDNFTVIDAFSRVVRLGEGLAQTGRLSDEAMDRAVGALRICADKLKRRNVHLAHSVATEACRRASNGAEFIERVRRETGIALNVISAGEEARLAVLGCHILLEDGTGPAVIFDIGGGSTELVLIEQGGGPVPEIVDWQSVPWGVVSLTETCGHDESTAESRAARYAEMRQRVADSFATFAERIAPARTPDLRLLGTSGTVTTLASVHLELPQYDRKAVDGLVVPAESMRAISANLSTLSPEERRQLPCIGSERADLVVAGCAILEAILDIWPADRLGVADRGIREGILRNLMSADNDGELARASLRDTRRAAR
ncbi:MAG: Ppx/GppA phosphatase family protein [Candidatus Andeanibacterium colombiense]|uniref:Ppx/GppA phosphatase family protein n=1 Tax=Candidatus Andeanibacterium colombiense TaxID=3121345 RepID=A0AAJ6BP75_9SPHN|nr:MAG: Ppx/GppA phosphatase family protein [Sphingomonadaceae bacterium]